MNLYHLIAKIERDKNPQGAPEWVLLFTAGTGQLADEKGTEFLVDEAAFEMVRQQVQARGNEVHFDYEHASVYSTQASPAAGWIKELTWREGVGIMARVEWTKQATSYIANREYRYFSPVFYIRKSDNRVCGLDSVALTNRPKTHNLTPLVAKAGGYQQEESIMDKAKLIAALGLEKDVTDADILAAVAKLGVTLPEEKTVEVVKMPEEVIAALDLKDDDTASVAVASIEALKQTTRTSVSMADFKALQTKIAQRDAADAVTAAIAKGKVTPDQKDWALEYAKKDLEGFNLYVAKAPQVVPVDDLPGGRAVTDGKEVDEATAQVAKMMDVDLEDIKKANG